MYQFFSFIIRILFQKVCNQQATFGGFFFCVCTFYFMLAISLVECEQERRSSEEFKNGLRAIQNLFQFLHNSCYYIGRLQDTDCAVTFTDLTLTYTLYNGC